MVEGLYCISLMPVALPETVYASAFPDELPLYFSVNVAPTISDDRLISSMDLPKGLKVTQNIPRVIFLSCKMEKGERPRFIETWPPPFLLS